MGGEKQEEEAVQGIEKKVVPRKGVKSLLIAVAIPLVLGILDAVFFSPNSSYYKELKKPWWNPPGWLFGFAWTVLYSLMGLASWLVWVEGGFQKQSRPLLIYGVQLFINLLWPAIFFGLKKPGLALLDIAVYFCMDPFKPVNHVAADLFKPYLAWVLFATALNYRIYTLN